MVNEYPNEWFPGWLGQRLFLAFFLSAQTQERQENMAHIHIGTTPGVTIDGLLAWAAGTDPGGLHVLTVWQSKAHMDRWTAEQLFPAFQSLGMSDVASSMEFIEYDADELYFR